MAQSMKGLLLMSLMFQGAGLFIKWRGWVHRVEGGLEGVRVFTFSLLLPFLLFRSTWAAALEPSLVLWFFWAIGFHALWTATTYAAYAPTVTASEGGTWAGRCSCRTASRSASRTACSARRPVAVTIFESFRLGKR